MVRHLLMMSGSEHFFESCLILALMPELLVSSGHLSALKLSDYSVIKESSIITTFPPLPACRIFLD